VDRFPHAQTQSPTASRKLLVRAVVDELYAQHSQRVDQPFTAVSWRPLREWKRSFEGERQDSQFAGLKERVEKAMNVSIQREVEKTNAVSAISPPCSTGAIRGPVRHCVGHHELIPGDRGSARHDTCSGLRAGIAEACSRRRSACLLQFLPLLPTTALSTRLALHGQARSLCRRILDVPLAPAR